MFFFFFQAEDGIRDVAVTGVQTCALPISFVCDATAGDHFNGKYGDLQSTPLTLTIKAARLVDAACARKDLEQEFWDYCPTDENSDRVGELAFGTNLGLTEMMGILLRDEKF